jgi:hypothetical protein
MEPISYVNGFKYYEDFILSGGSVTPTSQGHASAMLLLLIARKLQVRCLYGVQWHKVRTIFHKNRTVGLYNMAISEVCFLSPLKEGK